MKWIAPTEKDDGTKTLEQRLWEAADQLRANSGLTAQEYSRPVLGLIFLRFLRRQIANLRATRDLLLPRLMSGRLTLPEAEEAAQAAL